VVEGMDLRTLGCNTMCGSEKTLGHATYADHLVSIK
jgi:hypothetical protein